MVLPPFGLCGGGSAGGHAGGSDGGFSHRGVSGWGRSCGGSACRGGSARASRGGAVQRARYEFRGDGPARRAGGGCSRGGSACRSLPRKGPSGGTQRAHPARQCRESRRPGERVREAVGRGGRPSRRSRRVAGRRGRCCWHGGAQWRGRPCRRRPCLPAHQPRPRRSPRPLSVSGGRCARCGHRVNVGQVPAAAEPLGTPGRRVADVTPATAPPPGPCPSPARSGFRMRVPFSP